MPRAAHATRSREAVAVLTLDPSSMSVHQLRCEAWGLGRDNAGAALALLDVALRRDPDDVDVLWQKALFEHADDRLLDAESSLKRLVALRPRHAEAMALLVKVLRRLGRAEEASGWHRRREQLVAVAPV